MAKTTIARPAEQASHRADRATPSLRDEHRLELVLEQPVLALEAPPAGATKPSRVAADLGKDRLTVPFVAASFLGSPAGLAQGVTSLLAALLEGELVEGLLLVTVPATLAPLFHQHASRSTIVVLGKGPDVIGGV